MSDDLPPSPDGCWWHGRPVTREQMRILLLRERIKNHRDGLKYQIAATHPYHQEELDKARAELRAILHPPKE